MRHLFISDPLECMEQNETTKLFIAEALKRGHEVESGEVSDVFLNELGVWFKNEMIESFDVIWLRKDPPVDRRYLEHLQILAQVKGNVFFVNSPESILKYGDKLSAFNFSNYIPDTIVTSDCEVMKHFIGEHNGVIVKPLNSFSGKGVHKVTSIDEIEKVQHFLILQEFLPNIVEGDVRIHLAGGEIVGALKRVPAKDSILGNIHAGGSPEFIELPKELLELGKKIAHELMKEGIFFAGIDIIDGFLNEINVTSPGVIHETNEVMGMKLESKIFDLLIKNV